LDVAARLYEAALYFEVHEWLEPHWVTACGPTRETLQGLIQTAVGSGSIWRTTMSPAPARC